MKQRLDKALFDQKLVSSRSQAESFVKLGLVRVNNRVTTKSGYMISSNDTLQVEGTQYVSRAALKLASIARQFRLDFRGKTVLDVGSSTGGFTDYALQHRAKKVIAVDVGTDQLHPKLRADARVELYEKTDIRDVGLRTTNDERRTEKSPTVATRHSSFVILHSAPNVIVVDVSFISLTKILVHISTLMDSNSVLVAMCKPQFEAGKGQVNKGVVKNSAMRRAVLKDFEAWLKVNDFIILNKADSQVAGTKGNVERFYLLKKQR